MTKIMVDGTELAKDIVQAAYTHRGIISEGRLLQFKRLIDHTDVPLTAVLEEIALIPGNWIEGKLAPEVEGKAKPAHMIIKIVANMIAAYISTSFRFLSDKLKAHKNNSEQVFKEFKFSRARLLRASKLIQPLLLLDKKWEMVEPHHIEAIAENIEDVHRRLGSTGLTMFLGPGTLDAVRTWYSELEEE